MANNEHVAMLKQGVDVWNKWRDENRNIRPDLSGADLSEAELSEANLSRADLNGANLAQANLSRADLESANLRQAVLFDANMSKANLRGANLNVANLAEANLSGANLCGATLVRATLTSANLTGANLDLARLKLASLIQANLSGASLTDADLIESVLRRADLRAANLTRASLITTVLVDTDLSDADLTGCLIYGVSAWNLKLDRTKQQNLIITRDDEPTITVDNIEVAQFIYLMLHNQKICDVIDTITSKAVLILGRFTDERKAVLDALREELRKRNYLPIMFDFNVPATRDITETISLLARMARFVVVDITDAKSVPMELIEIVPHLPSIPVHPLLLEGSTEYDMFEHLKRYPWVLETYVYPSPKGLIANLVERVIGPAERYAGPTR